MKKSSKPPKPPKSKPKTASRPIGRPPLARQEDVKTVNIQYRLSRDDAELLDLASLYAGFRNRSLWARNRLLYLARSIVRSRHVDSDSPDAVRQALRALKKKTK